MFGDTRLRSRLVRAADAPDFSVLTFTTPSLMGNPLGEPPQRTVLVFDQTGHARPAPLVVVLPGAGGGLSHWLGLPQGPLGIIRALGAQANEMRIAFIDGGSSLGGTEWVDGPPGAWGQALGDVVTELRACYATSLLSLVGKSSGAYGAAMAGINAAFPIHRIVALAPDCGFEASFGPFIERLADRSRTLGIDPQDPTAIAALWRDISTSQSLSGDDVLDAVVLMCHQTFSPALDSPLPTDLVSLWANHDPLALLATQANELPPLWAIVGDRDEYQLTPGVVALGKAWSGPALVDVVPGGHGSVDALFPQAIAWAAQT